MAYTISPETRKQGSIEMTMKYGQWEPVYYDSYNEESGEWSFKTVDPVGASHVRHLVTGKMYRWNQRRRISRYDIQFELGRVK